MGRRLIKLILTDLDETLIHFGLTRATDHAIAAIRRAQAAGVTFAATTGRIRQGACAAFGFARECTQSAVMSNGQLVLADGQLIGQVELDREGMERLAAKLVGDRNFMLNVITRAETMEPVRVIVSDDPNAARRAFRADSDDVVVMDHLPDGPLVKSNIHVMGGVEQMGEVRERLEALCPGIRLMSPGPQVPMFDVAPKDWSKAKGAELLRRHLGIGVDEVAAFSDAENDLELLGVLSELRCRCERRAGGGKRGSLAHWRECGRRRGGRDRGHRPRERGGPHAGLHVRGGKRARPCHARAACRRPEGGVAAVLQAAGVGWAPAKGAALLARRRRGLRGMATRSARRTHAGRRLVHNW